MRKIKNHNLLSVLAMYLAEEFSNLNSISISIENDQITPSCAIKSIKIKSRGSVQVFINEYMEDVILPVDLKEGNEIRIKNLNKRQSSLTFSIHTVNGTQKIDESTMSFMDGIYNSGIQRWSCKDLQQKTPKRENKNDFKFCCIKCSSPIIDSSNINMFYDMPSEFWSEMMEFWHCHKPDIRKNEFSKNYNGNLKPKGNDAIIGSYYVLVNSSASEIQDSQVTCAQCNHVLGSLMEDTQKLLKWNLKLITDAKVDAYPPSLHLYNLLMNEVNLSATRKFIISSKYNDEIRSFYVWVLNIGINASFGSTIINRGIKVAYNTTPSTSGIEV
ncbi:Piso0_002575 [Millerozyma farinosa CBS 7064]|uniref:Piso0_002575 protein n=1 Tax=Pichia sorbitophila (strain ATCC MYA-4447 / BCRC 22081 / CBS 7064 / NBRC 10061 / NRRL Y-12695) TaxID=559304 RepID=G8YCZ4_PICSO|nr:Piso0_002575 [Millerozyma farinosa CBS 7064]